MVYREIRHLLMMKTVKQVVDIFEVFEMPNEVHIVMEVPTSSPYVL